MKKNSLKVGVVGATGIVGQTFMEILAERQFPVSELRPFASENSLGKKISLQGKKWECQVLKQGCFDGLDLVFFSSEDDISLEWAPQAAKAGAFAVDNSAAFRTSDQHLLIVPEVNGHLLKNLEPQVIANPNCTTIQLVVALKPLAEKFGINQVRVSSYQAVSGAGQPGVDELLAQASETSFKDGAKKILSSDPQKKTFPHPIIFNAIPQIGSFNSDGYCSEEVKVMYETKKILGLNELKVSAFTVRIPALVGHSESVWVTLDKEVSKEEVNQALGAFPGLVLQDDPQNSVYPMARKAAGTDPVYVGRVHRDINDPKTWLMWVVADNVRKGAALNGIQIAERLFDINV